MWDGEVGCVWSGDEAFERSWSVDCAEEIFETLVEEVVLVVVVAVAECRALRVARGTVGGLVDPVARSRLDIWLDS